MPDVSVYAGWTRVQVSPRLHQHIVRRPSAKAATPREIKGLRPFVALTRLVRDGALVLLGIANSKMKDFFDLWILSRHSAFDGPILSSAIRATFERRATALPAGQPFGLSEAFVQDARKQTQWKAFLRRNVLDAVFGNRHGTSCLRYMLPQTGLH